MLNVGSENDLPPGEVPNQTKSTIVDQEKYALKSPGKATQEEIDLTKHYIGVASQLKQSKMI